jgi:hypothetical protein
MGAQQTIENTRANQRREIPLSNSLAIPSPICWSCSSLPGPEMANRERRRMRVEFGLPVCDVYRHGAEELVDAVLALQSALRDTS